MAYRADNWTTTVPAIPALSRACLTVLFSQIDRHSVPNLAGVLNGDHSEDVSRTFSEYLLLPRLTRKGQRADLVDIGTPISAVEPNCGWLKLNAPLVSACMQAVSGADLSVALARQGGLSFVFCSQPIDQQVEMVKRVKSHKAGFVESDSNCGFDTTLEEVVELMQRTGHSTVPVTEDGTATGKLLGIITDNDFWQFEDDLSNSVGDHMTPFDQLIYGEEGISLRGANELLHQHKKDCLPIIDGKGCLSALVFKKDYEDHRRHPRELLDESKRLCVGGAINTHDYQVRVPALIEAGVDALCFDSSDGYTEYQLEGIQWIRDIYGKDVVIGGGNVVSAEGFDFLVEEGGVDFIKSESAVVPSVSPGSRRASAGARPQHCSRWLSAATSILREQVAISRSVLMAVWRTTHKS